jgi:hypothetical protein
MAIKIKKSHKGLLHKNLGVKEGEKIPASKLKVKSTDSAAVKKRKVFAQNARKWKHELGGPVKYADGGSNQWTNNLANPSPVNSEGIGQSKKLGVSVGQGAGYAAAATQALSPLWTGSKYYKEPDNTTMHQVGSGIKGIASNIPIAGAFVQAGDMLGKGFDTAANKALDKGNQTAADAAYFFKGMSDPISNFETIDKLRKSGKLTTGQAVGYGLTHLVGGPGISEAVLQKKFKNELHTPPMTEEQKANLSFGAKPTTNSEIQSTTPEDYMLNGGSLRTMSKYNNGGDAQLEQYNTGLHKDMPDDFANAQLDGKPIQLQRKETIFRKKDGGDYVFTDNIINPETGNPISEDSKKIEKKTQKPFYDKAALNTKKYQLNQLSKINDAERAKVEAKEYGGVPKALNGLNGEEIITSPNNFNFWDSQYNEGSKQYRQASPEEQWTTRTKIGPSEKTNIPQLTGNETTPLYSPFSMVQPADTYSKYKTLRDKKETSQLSNNLTTGDYLQLAGQVPALAYNTAMAFKKPEEQKLYLDKTPITQQNIAKNYNPTYLALNSAYRGIDEGSSSDAVRRAAKISALSAIAPKLQEYDLAVDNANQSLRGQYEDKISNQARFNVGQRLTTDDINARNRAATRAFGATAASNLGQGLTTFGLAKNQGLTNKMQYNTLQHLVANYELDPETYDMLIKNGYLKPKYKK